MLYSVLVALLLSLAVCGAFGGDKNSEFRLKLLGILRFVVGCERFDSSFASNDSHEDLLTS